MHYFTLEQRESLQTQMRTLRTELDEALARLHTPDFGLCAECGAEIPFAYLRMHLTATRCAACDARRSA